MITMRMLQHMNVDVCKYESDAESGFSVLNTVTDAVQFSSVCVCVAMFVHSCSALKWIELGIDIHVR